MSHYDWVKGHPGHEENFPGVPKGIPGRNQHLNPGLSENGLLSLGGHTPKQSRADTAVIVCWGVLYFLFCFVLFLDPRTLVTVGFHGPSAC